jgi:hypothetical protein
MTEFIPTKEMWHVYFCFYTNSIEEIETFKKQLKDLYPYILGFKKTDDIDRYKLLVYVTSQEECNKMKNAKTLELYNEFVERNNEEGYNVF